ncbi:3-hydroxyacyl-ACP dehydratase FabZ [bacterium]|nr:3-hydroxyacyl-ACP dehydratase FabZ [bacterium]
MEQKKPLMDFQKVCELLPHRPPLLLVDKIMSIDFDSLDVHAVKCVTAGEPYLAGHFPGQPIVPGVYLIEGLAQTAAAMCFANFDKQGIIVEKKCMLTGVDEVKFRKPVVPGDVIHYFATYERHRGPFVWFNGVVKVDGETVAEAKFSAVLAKSPKN